MLNETETTPGTETLAEKQIVALGLQRSTQDERELFMDVCARTGLDPTLGQIYLVPRWSARDRRNTFTIQVGIDGYRLIAERTGRYVGSDEEWGASDQNGFPSTATATVKKLVDGAAYEFRATAHWAEYCQTQKDGKPAKMWAQLPHRMLSKCAEALALRKAFPQELSGIYTTEEMQQAENGPSPLPVAHGPLPQIHNVDEARGYYSERRALGASAKELAEIVSLGKRLKAAEDEAAMSTEHDPSKSIAEQPGSRSET